jgi:hypothetical protein
MHAVNDAHSLVARPASKQHSSRRTRHAASQRRGSDSRSGAGQGGSDDEITAGKRAPAGRRGMRRQGRLRVGGCRLAGWSWRRPSATTTATTTNCSLPQVLPPEMGLCSCSNLLRLHVVSPLKPARHSQAGARFCIQAAPRGPILQRACSSGAGQGRAGRGGMKLRGTQLGAGAVLRQETSSGCTARAHAHLPCCCASRLQ